MADATASTVSQSAYDRAVRQAIHRKGRVHELEAELAKLRKDHETAAAALKATTTERDDFKSKLETDPDGLRSKVIALESKLRERTHRDAFNAAAGKFKGANGETVVPTAIEALWTLSGYKPEGDQADEAKLLKVIGEAVASHPFTLAAPDGAKGSTAPPTAPAPKPPGPGAASRGAPETTPPPASVKAQVEAAFAKSGAKGSNRIA